jgi:hypothetical protein
MGFVIIDSGTRIHVDEVESEVTLSQLFTDVVCEHYTEVYRIKCIKAWGKLNRNGWAILPVLHELTKSSNKKLSEAAGEAIKKIDPGAPTISTISTDRNQKNGHPNGCSCKDCYPQGYPESLKPKATKSNLATLGSSVSRNKFQVQDGYGQTHWKDLEIKKVTITDIPVKNGDLAEGTRVTGVCNFCGKHATFSKNLRQANKVIVGDKSLFCNFCLRNEYYREKEARNTLMLSFRGIIGYYYYCFHQVPKISTMYMQEIEAIIALHVKVGTQNPLFRYDPESYIWFVDFSKVGNKRQQMPLNYVLETVVDILCTFNLYENAKETSPATLYNKYKEAIVEFHHHRTRPAGQKILLPTLYSCGIPYETVGKTVIPISFLRNFVPNHMVETATKKGKGMY